MPTKPTTAAELTRETRHVLHGTIRAVRSDDGKSVKLGGHAAVYNKRSEYLGWFFEEIAPGAFATAISGADDVRCLMNHDSGRVLGRNVAKTLRLSDDGVGLAFELDVPDTNDGRDLVVSVERGDISQMSFGFEVRSEEDEAWHQELRPDGSSFWVRKLLRVALYDVSPVAYPAYPDTDIAKRRLEHRSHQPQPGRQPSLRASRVDVAERRLRMLNL